MPAYRSNIVLEVARGVRAFLKLDVGVVRGPVPDFEKMFEQAQSQVKRKDRQLQQMRKRLPGANGRPKGGERRLEQARKQPSGPGKRARGPAGALSYETIYEAHIEARTADVAIGRESFDAIGRLELALLQQEGLEPTDTLLDLGCGTGRLAVHVIPTLVGGHYIGIDIAQTMLKEARERIERTVPDPPGSVSWVHQTEPAFALDTDSVDMICAFSVINHMEHEDAYLYLKEALRVVRPGGHFVFSCLPLDTKRAQEVFLKTAQMDLETRHRTVRHVATSREFMDNISRLAGWTPLHWYNGDEENIRMPDGDLRNFGQSICVLQAPLASETGGANGTAS